MVRNRKIGSIRTELLKKSREAAIAAVQIFNNPSITFKTELYIVTMIIAWTYLLHAYYRGEKIEYRYFKQIGQRKSFDKTKNGANKHWELERCLNHTRCPLPKPAVANLRFLIGLRHEIEHQMTTNIDNNLSAKLQACCLNYNAEIKKIWGNDWGLDRHLSISLQFSRIAEEQITQLRKHQDLPKHISGFIDNFEHQMSNDDLINSGYAYRVLFTPINVNRQGQADQVIEFIKSDSPLAKDLEAAYALVKESEKPKYLPSQIVKLMKEEGFHFFSMHMHTFLWQSESAKDPQKNLGTLVGEKSWYWYDSWLKKVRDFCQKEARRRVAV